MRLGQIGELNLLREIRKRFKTENGGVLLGIGDDAAVIAPQKENILVTTDMMNEGIHFDLSFTAPFHLGFKLVSVNVSDIFAMGGVPKYLFLNVALKSDADEEMFGRLYEGISKAMNMYGVKLAGGDLCAAKNDMVLSATVIGAAEKFIPRSGAKAGDKIYVTGALGDSACGLEILKRLPPEEKEKVRGQEVGAAEFGAAASLIMKHLMPIACDSSEFAKYASSMIDISDGLFIDLNRICDESNAGARIYLNEVPVSDNMRAAAESMGLDAMRLATAGGEDYELLFTAPWDARIENAFCIGEISEKERIAVDEQGKEIPMKAEGYQHF
jgi:thiamine-monophosphate kinase